MTPRNGHKPLIPYLRQSRAKEKTISIDEQRRAIRKWAKAAKVTLADELVEQGVSGSRPWRERALGDAMRAVEEGRAQGIIVAFQDRLSRENGLATAEVWQALEQAEARLVCAAEGLDTATGDHEMLFTIKAAIARDQWKRHRTNWENARRNAVERGIHVASRAPTGYRRGKDGRLVPVKRDAAAVYEVFRRRAAGASWRELADLLMQRRVRGPYGGEQWTTSAVSKLVANPVYTGEARSGENRKANAHPAIVTSTEWRAAQGARSASVPRSGEGALLSGVLRCGGCRYVLKPDTMNGRNGEKLRIYRCRGEHAAGRCPEPATVMGRVIEPFVEQTFLDALGPKGPLARSTRSDRALARARQELEVTEAELETWIGLGVNELGADVYLVGLRQRQAHVEEAREHLEIALAAAAGPLGDVPDAVHLRDLWPSLGIAERRRLISAGIDAVILFRGHESIEERALVLYRGEAPADLPARGRRVPLRSFERPLGLGKASTQDLEEDEPDRPIRDRRQRAQVAA